jgi:ADP-ribosylglycohydrolase
MTQGDLLLDRAKATMIGLAIGDALGMPSQTLSRQAIGREYGQISSFVAPFPGHPVSHGLVAGQVTDDTEQSLLLARRLIAEPDRFDDLGWAHDLLEWERDIRARGLRDLLGPSSKAALDALLAGVSPEETGRRGTTNGAAMRIAPVGVMTPPEPDLIAARVARTCRVTHNTGEAIAAASAVAMVVSMGTAGHGFEDSLDAALQAARQGQMLGHPAGDADVAACIVNALEIGARGSLEVLIAGVGTSVKSRESVPAAFGLLRLAAGDPWRAMLLAANIGDDTDTIGAMTGAMGAACAGMQALPPAAVATVTRVNRLGIEDIATALVALRVRQAEPVR